MFFQRFTKSTSKSKSTRTAVRKPKKSQLGLETLEDRAVPASMVLAESTFDPQLFADNVGDIMDYNVVGYAFGVNHEGVANAASGTGGLYGPNDGRGITLIDNPETAFLTDTKIEVAGISKVITTAAVLHLMESLTDDVQGMLSTPIYEYLPADWSYGANIHLVTIRHLLTHTSPFVEGGPGDAMNPLGINFEIHGNNNFQNLKAMVAQDGGIPALQLPDGSAAWAYNYSNVNYSLLAKMIPYMRQDVSTKELNAVAGDSPGWLADDVFGAYYEEYVANNILAPAGIVAPSMSVNVLNSAKAYDFATAEIIPGVSQQDWTDRGGAFGWKLAATDLTKFLNDLQQGNILSQSSMDLMNNAEFMLGWYPDTVVNGNPIVLSPMTDAFGTYYQHAGGYGTVATAFTSQIVAFPGDIQASLVFNNGTFTDNVNMHTFDVLKTAYTNAWSDLVIEADDSDNVIVVQLNGADPDLLDVIIDGETVLSHAVDGFDSLEIRGLGGNDTFEIRDVPEDLSLKLDGGADDDTFDVDVVGGAVFQKVLGNLDIVGGTGSDNLSVDDSNGLNTYYHIHGNVNPALDHDGHINATNYTSGKDFLYTDIEGLVLEANAGSNTIIASNIHSDLMVEIYGGDGDDLMYLMGVESGSSVGLYGEGGNDTFGVRDTALNTIITVIGDDAMAMGGDDTLLVGDGNLGSVQGTVYFAGAEGSDLMVLDDTLAPQGRHINFDNNLATGSDWMGDISYSTTVEKVVLHGSHHDDSVNVETQDYRTELELFGFRGDDTFFIAGTSHDVNGVESTVIIHGGMGYENDTNPETAKREDNDEVYVFDDKTSLTGDFTIDEHGGPLFGRVNKLVAAGEPNLNVIYDQIENTYLHADDGINEIDINAAPWYNRVHVYAGGGNDKIDIESTPQFEKYMYIYGEEGADAIRISPDAQNLDNIHAMPIIHGGDGAPTEQDYLAVYDNLSGSTSPIRIFNDQLWRDGAPLITYNTVENMSVSLSNQDNTIDVDNALPGTNISIYGNFGDDSLTARNIESDVTFFGGFGDDETLLEGTAGDDIFTALGSTMQLGNGTLVSYAESRSIDGLAGTDRLDLLGVEGVDDDFVISPSTTANQGRVNPGFYTEIDYENVEQMSVEGNAADADTLQVKGQTELNEIGGGVHKDRFNIDLTAEGTAVNPVMQLLNTGYDNLFTLLDYDNLGAPTFSGGLGADTFNLTVNPDPGSESRQVHIDGGHDFGGLKTGDQLHLHYEDENANLTWWMFGWEDGSIGIDYGPQMFGITYEDIEGTSENPF